MAERLLPRKLLALPRFPVVARAIALAVLVAAVAAIGVYLYTRQAPAVAQPEEPELAGDGSRPHPIVRAFARAAVEQTTRATTRQPA